MNTKIYSVFLREDSVELRPETDRDEESEFTEARFICSQKNYQSILDFASNLAKYKHLLFINHAHDLEG